LLLRDLIFINWNEFLINLIFAAILIFVGIFLGQIAKWILRKIAKKSKLDRSRGYNFFKLFITVVTWSIYLLFLNLGLVQLDIPLITDWLSSIILIIPALTGALILIVVGFVIATYLRDLIEESKISNWKILSQIFWYFVLYIFTLFAFKTALISLDKQLVNMLLIVMSVVVGASVVLHNFKRK